MTPKSETAIVAAKRTFHQAIDCHSKNFERFIVLDDVRRCLIHIDERLDQLEDEIATGRQPSETAQEQGKPHLLIQISFSQPGSPRRTHSFIQETLEITLKDESAHFWMSSVDEKGSPIGLGKSDKNTLDDYENIGYIAVNAFLWSLASTNSDALRGVAKAIVEDIVSNVGELLRTIDSANNNKTAEVYDINLCVRDGAASESVTERIIRALKEAFSGAQVKIASLLSN